MKTFEFLRRALPRTPLGLPPQAPPRAPPQTPMGKIFVQQGESTLLNEIMSWHSSEAN